MSDKLKRGCIVQVKSTGKYGILSDLQYPHNRYQLRNVSGWQYDISDLQVVSAGVLIEQLEQAQIALHTHESYNKTVCELQAELEQAQAANQKLVECLEWYGNPENHLEDQVGYKDFSRYEFDAGQRARQLLSEVKGNA